MANDAHSEKSVTMTDNASGRKVTFSVSAGTLGPDVIDIQENLYGETGMFTFDPGYGATGSCVSGLTLLMVIRVCYYIAGTQLKSLRKKQISSNLRTYCLRANCQTRWKKKNSDTAITRHTMVNEQLSAFFRGFRRDAHPMAILCGVTGALSAFYHDSTDIHDPRQRMIASHRMIAKMPTLASMAFKYCLDNPSTTHATI